MESNGQINFCSLFSDTTKQSFEFRGIFKQPGLVVVVVSSSSFEGYPLQVKRRRRLD